MADVIYSPGVVAQRTTGPGVLSNSYSHNGFSGYVYNPSGSTGTAPTSSYNVERDKMEGYFPDYHSKYSLKDIDSFLDKYIKYNYDLYTDAQAYDVMMSNTAIRRQMEDLKAAGINPILAGRLGGAQYKGVSAPYISINPSSALGSLMDFESDVYNANLNYEGRMKEIASREKISENELKQQATLAEKYIAAELESAGISASAIVQAAKINGLTQKEIQEMRGEVDVQIQDMYNSIWKEINDKQLETEKQVAKDNNIVNIVGSGIRTIGTLIGAYIISHKGDKGDPSGHLPLTSDRKKYNDWFNKTILGAPSFTSFVPVW